MVLLLAQHAQQLAHSAYLQHWYTTYLTGICYKFHLIARAGAMWQLQPWLLQSSLLRQICMTHFNSIQSMRHALLRLPTGQ